MKILRRAFEYANNYVLESTGCATLGDISNGWCETRAKAVNSDTREEGLALPE
jgi:hypothetical protein